MEAFTERTALMETIETSREVIDLQLRTCEKESKELQQWKMSLEERRGKQTVCRGSLFNSVNIGYAKSDLYVLTPEH